MTTTELRELDAWIAFHVMKATSQLIAIQYPDISFFPHYTTDPSAAMGVLKKCAERVGESKMEWDCVQVQALNGEWHVCSFEGDEPVSAAPTLELAICLFAKKLFGRAP